MAFTLSPLRIDRFPFKINPMVENIHSTATGEALHACEYCFCHFFQVFKLHMDLPEQKRIFAHLIICLTLQIWRYFCTNCFFNWNVNTVLCFCSRRWRLLIGFDSSSWLPVGPSSTAMEVDELSASDSAWSLMAISRFLVDRPRSVTNMTESFIQW